MKKFSFHPEVRRMLDTLTELKESAEYRSNIISSYEYQSETEEEQMLRRVKAQSTAEAYAFCILLLQNAKI